MFSLFYVISNKKLLFSHLLKFEIFYFFHSNLEKNIPSKVANLIKTSKYDLNSVAHLIGYLKNILNLFAVKNLVAEKNLDS